MPSRPRRPVASGTRWLRRRRRRWRCRREPAGQPAVVVTSKGPSSSGPIQITPDDKFVFVANPDNNSVTMMNVAGDANVKVAEIPVGKKPRHLAISPDGKRVFVANSGADTVSVINATATAPDVIAPLRSALSPTASPFRPMEPSFT